MANPGKAHHQGRSPGNLPFEPAWITHGLDEADSAILD
jgi:hypothetical protein